MLCHVVPRRSDLLYLSCYSSLPLMAVVHLRIQLYAMNLRGAVVATVVRVTINNEVEN